MGPVLCGEIIEGEQLGAVLGLAAGNRSDDLEAERMPTELMGTIDTMNGLTVEETIDARNENQD